jgi:hypothetical protein
MPPERISGPLAFVLSILNWAVPAGVPEAGGQALITAVKTTAFDGNEGLAEELTVPIEAANGIVNKAFELSAAPPGPAT